jgi:ADP-ribose pyrophosphatase
MRSWETISKRVILKHSQYLSVESHDIRLPNGEIILDWPWIVTPDFVIIIVVSPEGEFILFRQTKYSIEGDGLAPIGGYLNQDELPLTAAKRELYEEIGYSSPNWTHLGSYPVDGNRGAGTAHLFLALDAVKMMSEDNIPVSDDLEEQEIVILTKEEVNQALLHHEIKVLPWVAALALALHHLKPM